MSKKLYNELNELAHNKATFKKISSNGGATTPNKLYEGSWGGFEKCVYSTELTAVEVGIFYFDGHTEHIHTSPVKTIIKHDENTYHLETRNSVYELTFIED